MTENKKTAVVDVSILYKVKDKEHEYNVYAQIDKKLRSYVSNALTAKHTGEPIPIVLGEFSVTVLHVEGGQYSDGTSITTERRGHTLRLEVGWTPSKDDEDLWAVRQAFDTQLVGWVKSLTDYEFTFLYGVRVQQVRPSPSEC